MRRANSVNTYDMSDETYIYRAVTLSCIQIAAIWLVLEPAVIKYLWSMVDILPQRVLMQRDFANNV